MSKHIAVFFTAVVFGTLTLVTPFVASAQGTAEKIQLMAEALRARDAGDLTLAKAKAEELNQIAPDDQNAQRLLESINEELGEPVAPEPSLSAESVETTSVDTVVAAVVADQNAKIDAARTAIPKAMKLAELGAYDEALEFLDSKGTNLTLNTTTKAVHDQINDAKDSIIAMRAASIPVNIVSRVSIQEASPGYVAQSAVIDDLLVRGRTQYLNGDYDGAASTFNEVEARDANNKEAKLFQTRIAEILGKIHTQNLYKTREQMLTEVDQGWERPKVFEIDKEISTSSIDKSGILQQMESIIIPQVNFSGMELTRVIDTLSELSVEYDPLKKGVNIVPLFDPNVKNPRVNISLRNLNLDLILKFVTQQVNFSYDVGGDAVTVAFTDAIGGDSSNLTEFFPISRATIIRLVGIRANSYSSV